VSGVAAIPAQAAATLPVLAIDGLTVRFGRSAPAIERADLEIRAGEVHGLVGESGSGKTMLARAVLRLLPPGAAVSAGSIRFQGQELTTLPDAAMRKLRGPRIGMVFQEPMMSLNPALRIGAQMAEAMRLHTTLGGDEIRRRSLEMLERVRMPDPERCLASYPHEFSGGMRQRIMLASVLMLRPALLLADEPTTALDVLIQQEVIEIMLEIVRDFGTAVLLITHDLGLVARYAGRMTVMRKGTIVETGEVERIMSAPREPYTRSLIAALPGRRAGTGGTIGGNPLVSVRNLSVSFTKPARLPWRKPTRFKALDDISFDVMRNETLAVVGESGSGKTTLGRALLKLGPAVEGRILLDGQDIAGVRGDEERRMRRRMQVVFQDPYASLDPRQTIGRIVAEGLRHVPGVGRAERREKVAAALSEVGIDPAWSDRYPHELSGGQRQRVGIARAIVTEPELVIADEAVSALDLTVQAQVLDLLQRLKGRIGFSCLFITHDLGVVEQVADRILVLYRGRIVEIGMRDAVLDAPHHPYTCALLNAVPSLVPTGSGGCALRERHCEPPPPPPGLVEDPHWRGDDDGVGRTFFEIAPGHLVAYGSSRDRET